VKILAKFLLSGVFVFFAGVPVWAQDCGHGILWNHDEQNVIDDLEQRQDCLNKKLQSQDNDYPKIEIYDLQDKLKQTELDLHSAETKIETQEASLHLIERRLAMAEDEIEWLTPRRSAFKTPASKPKAPVNQPKAAAGKPKTTASKPTTEWDAQGNPIQPTTKPKGSG
jgi:septal ring factor EnvC (AmiA/AmiB activator)